MTNELKQLIREAINVLGSNCNSEDLMLALRLHRALDENEIKYIKKGNK